MYAVCHSDKGQILVANSLKCFQCSAVGFTVSAQSEWLRLVF